jgi:hypothetical protein
MMNGRVDLHIHSLNSSDGDFAPVALLQMAKEKGLRAISISDHDTVGAYPDALEWSDRLGVELIPSVELTTLFDGREFHLLLPFVCWESRPLGGILATVTRARMEEAKDRVAKLRELGFEIDWDEVLLKTKGGPPLGVSIAQILIDKGREEKDPSLQKYYEGTNRLFAPYFFYRDYFLEEKPAFVRRRTVSLLEVLDRLAQVLPNRCRGVGPGRHRRFGFPRPDQASCHLRPTQRGDLPDGRGAQEETEAMNDQ